MAVLLRVDAVKLAYQRMLRQTLAASLPGLAGIDDCRRIDTASPKQPSRAVPDRPAQAALSTAGLVSTGRV
ncbi:hypothetical protein [Bradyrhizobium sp. SK17]|uniref:hypothetical protein n=2 Tax=Nitrobacteraceae TaxID=41294 RepID=UPI0012FE2A6C|nr:hypothetical protein [Bradyrhizobium sp. SK17]